MADDKTDIAKVVERIEGLDGSDRQVDAEIGLATGAFFTVPNKGWPDRLDYCRINGDGSQTFPGNGFDQLVPAYTASIDAAMTLVPEGWGWNISQPNARALASGLLKKRTPCSGEVQNGCEDRYAVAGATPALALCAAALRARTHRGEG